jgi:hypothetical protein
MTTSPLEYRRGSAQLHEINLMGSEKGSPANPLIFHPWQIRTFRFDATR